MKDKSLSGQLSIVSVAFPDFDLLGRNLELTSRLNPRHESRWIVVDNTSGADVGAAAEAMILPGAARPVARDRGSLHHGMALEKGLREVRTRFVLFMDPDFYVIREDWIETLLEHVAANGIAIFGSVWHPRWYYQYRHFPSVHFMLIDLQSVPPSAIDPKPLVHSDRRWQAIEGSRILPGILRDTLKVQRCRDTGWQIYRRFFQDPAARAETLLPHYVPPAGRRLTWEKRLRPLLPESWCKYPTDPGSYTEESFLKASHGDAYRQGWEEFF
jgi:hypothetical protein